jgi:hypothetical protein
LTNDWTLAGIKTNKPDDHFGFDFLFFGFIKYFYVFWFLPGRLELIKKPVANVNNIQYATGKVIATFVLTYFVDHKKFISKIGLTCLKVMRLKKILYLVGC